MTDQNYTIPISDLCQRIAVHNAGTRLCIMETPESDRARVLELLNTMGQLVLFEAAHAVIMVAPTGMAEITIGSFFVDYFHSTKVTFVTVDKKAQLVKPYEVTPQPPVGRWYSFQPPAPKAYTPKYWFESIKPMLDKKLEPYYAAADHLALVPITERAYKLRHSIKGFRYMGVFEMTPYGIGNLDTP